MTTPVDATSRARSDAALVRALGVWGLAATIVNVTIGGGIFRLPASAAALLGSAAPLAYIVCAIAMGLIVLCFAEAGSRVSMTGGPYAYVEVAFGPFIGFMAGVLLWLSGTFAIAAVATVFADNLARLLPAFGGPGARPAALVLTLVLVAAINVFGVKQGTRLSVVATIAKLAPLALLVVAGVFAIRGENLAMASAPGIGDLSRASVVLIFAFAGIESALVPSGEVREPARTVPRAIALAMVAITMLYVLLHLVAQGVLGAALATSATPLADAAGVVLGPWGATLLAAGVVVSTFGYVGGMTLAMPRALYAFGRDGILPRAMASVHPRFHTPHVAILVQTAMVIALALTGVFEKLAIVSNIAALALYLACAAAAWELRRRDVRQGGGLPFRVPGAAIVPVLAILVIIGILASTTPGEWAWLVGTLVVASVLYVLGASSRRASAGAVP